VSTPAPKWKKVAAFALDLLGSFFAFGYGIGALTGNTSKSGFRLEGGWALLVIALVIAYFVLMNRCFGTTLGKLILGIRRSNAESSLP
jgi:uncharacterized RDD family membrane protein YckC